MPDLNLYKLSKYNFVVEKNDNVLVMNLHSRAIVEFECKKEFLMPKIESLSEEQILFLIENRFIVLRNTDEYKEYLDHFNWRRSDNIIAFTIGFSMNCNFNCLYCIQKGNYDIKKNISKENLNKLYEWIEKPILNRKQNFSINIFGGEPTLNIDNIFYFLKKTNALADELGIEPYYQMVTNGFLLNEKVIKKLLDFRVFDYQITLDGVGDIHDKRRSVTFKSFEKIVENIMIIVKNGGNVNLLHVFDESNLNSGFDLIDYFVHIFDANNLEKKKILFNFVVTIPKQVEEVKCNKHVYGKEKYLTHEGVECAKYASEKGFGVVNTLEVSCCFRQLKNSFLVDPDLNLYKCYSIFGDKKYVVNNISDQSFEDFIHDGGEKWSNMNGFTERCFDCDFVPFCRGGCQFAASETNKGKYGYSFCEKEYMKEQLKGFILNGLYN